MNILNKLFFCFDFIFYVVFCYYYNNGKINEKNFPPVGKAYFHIVIMLGTLIMAIDISLKHVTQQYRTSTVEKHFTTGLTVFTLVCGYFLFLYRKRYVDIYNRFKQKPFANSKNGKRSGWFLYFLGLASPMLLAYIRFKLRY